MSLKSLLSLAEAYLRNHPTPNNMTLFQNALKLNYVFQTPFANTKKSSQVLMPIQNISEKKKSKCVHCRLIFDEKNNSIEEENSFESISTEQFHEKLIQDDVFGKAKRSKDGNRWVYVAKEKTKKLKSLFLGGSGKTEYESDFGETYDDVCNVGIYVWDVPSKKIIKVKVDSGEKLIPACPSFANESGSKIVFHAYHRTEFGYGLLHCFNRPVSIYEAEITSEEEVKVKKFETKNKTNMFPVVSCCSKFLAFFGGEGITHTYPLSLFIYKKDEGQWKQLHKIENIAIGFYDTLKIYPFTQKGEGFVFYQTLKDGVHKIMKTHLESGKTEEAIEGKTGESFSISSVFDEEGIILGKVNTHNYNTFFYIKNRTQYNFIPPLNQQQFTLHQYQKPIHAYYLEAKENIQFKREKKPLIILVHGGPHGLMDPALTLFRYLLLKCGYAILLPNFSGSAGFGEEHLNKALGNIGKTDANQILDLLKMVLEERPYLDKEKVHTCGRSYGGYMSAIFGSKYHEHFRSAIILNGVVSIPGNLWFSDIPQWNTVETLKTDSFEKLTQNDYAQMVRQSPGPMKIPTLQFLGAKDKRAAYRQGLLFDAITKKLGTKMKTYVYENSGHSFTDSVETSVDVVIKSMMFLEEIEEPQ